MHFFQFLSLISDKIYLLKMGVAVYVGIAISILVIFIVIKILGSGKAIPQPKEVENLKSIMKDDNICKSSDEIYIEEFLIRNNIELLGLNQDSCDILVLCKNGQVKAHKVILAAYSEVFERMIQNASNVENQLTKIELTDIDIDVLWPMLKFIYDGKFPKVNINYNDLLLSAEHYEISALKCELEKLLESQINNENVGDLLVTAEQANAKFLKFAASKYLMTHLADIRKTSAYKNVASRYPGLITTAIDVLGNLPENSTCEIECHSLNKTSPLIVRRLKRFMITEHFTDAEIKFGNQTFKVNRAILIEQSNEWQKLFRDNTNKIYLEPTENDVTISTIVMKEFLIYMYSGWVQQLNSIAEQLLMIANKFQMFALKAACENVIYDKLNTNNAAELLVIADKASSRLLSRKIVDFILKNKNAVVGTAGWNKLKTSHSHILHEIINGN